jgi:hypothetical protein
VAAAEEGILMGVRRRRAFLVFGSLTLLLAGYAGWCTHWMWMDARVPELLEIPAEYREDAKTAVAEQGLTRREPIRFSWKWLWLSLVNPYETPKWRPAVQVFPEKPQGTGARVLSVRGHDRERDAEILFHRELDGWSMVTTKRNGDVSVRMLKEEK